MKKLAVAFVVLGLSGTAAGAVDLGELAPCWAAATKFCDRSAGMTWSNLLRCGDTLAVQRFRIGNSCRADSPSGVVNLDSARELGSSRRAKAALPLICLRSR